MDNQLRNDSIRVNAVETINKLEPITTVDNLRRKSKHRENSTSQSTSEILIAEEEAMVREKLKITDELMAEAMLRYLWMRLVPTTLFIWFLEVYAFVIYVFISNRLFCDTSYLLTL